MKTYLINIKELPVFKWNKLYEELYSVSYTIYNHKPFCFVVYADDDFISNIKLPENCYYADVTGRDLSSELKLKRVFNIVFIIYSKEASFR